MMTITTTNNSTVNAAIQAAMAAVAAPVVTVNPAHVTNNTIAEKKEVSVMKTNMTMTKKELRAALEEKNVTMSDSKFKATKLADLQAMLDELEKQPVLTAESSDAPIDKVDVETLTTQQSTQKPVKPVFSWKNYWQQNAPGIAATSFASAVNALMLSRGSQPTKLGDEFKKLSAMAHSFIKAKAGNGNVEFPKKFSVNSYTMNGKSFATCVFRVNGGAWYALGIVYEVSDKGYYKPVSYNYIRK